LNSWVLLSSTTISWMLIESIASLLSTLPHAAGCCLPLVLQDQAADSGWWGAWEDQWIPWALSHGIHPFREVYLHRPQISLSPISLTSQIIGHSPCHLSLQTRYAASCLKFSLVGDSLHHCPTWMSQKVTEVAAVHFWVVPACILYRAIYSFVNWL
jgi:hypothetical protein